MSQSRPGMSITRLIDSKPNVSITDRLSQSRPQSVSRDEVIACPRCGAFVRRSYQRTHGWRHCKPVSEA